MKILSLDLSTENSGYAVMCVVDGEIILDKYGAIPKQTYSGHSKEKYPQKTTRLASSMAEAIDILIDEVSPDKIIIEEMSIGHKTGVKQVKGLAMLHGMLCYLLNNSEGYIDFVEMMPPSGQLQGGLPGWRSIIKLKKNGDFKKASVDMANELYNLNLSDNEHDASDAILLGTAYLRYIMDSVKDEGAKNE